MKVQGLGFTNTIIATALFCSMPITSITAKEIAIYRWVDANNVVHFSQNLPKTDNYTQLSTVSSFKALSKEDRQEKAAQDDEQQRADSQAEDIAQNKATFEKNCQAAQLNVKMLNSYDEVLVTEETSDGVKTERVLSDEEKKDKLSLSKKHIELYCK